MFTFFWLHSLHELLTNGVSAASACCDDQKKSLRCNAQGAERSPNDIMIWQCVFTYIIIVGLYDSKMSISEMIWGSFGEQASVNWNFSLVILMGFAGRVVLSFLIPRSVLFTLRFPTRHHISSACIVLSVRSLCSDLFRQSNKTPVS